jgi:dihydrofolate synthase/folylpolyglutamate synthase
VRIEGRGTSLQARVALLGEHQYDNATAAVAALHALARTRPSLAVAPVEMEHGLAQVEWPGRLQVLSERPWLVLDGAHNAASAEVVRRAVDASFAFENMAVVLGVTAGKDAEGVLQALLPRATKLYLTRSRHERSADPSELVTTARQLRPDLDIVVERDVDAALHTAQREARANDLVLVTGSLFLVGEALVWWHRSHP